jgi:hypothetical protein
MNVFYLHHLPRIAATYHCDKHVGKMLIESCQLLATAHHHFDNGDKVSYRPTHANHPSAVWVRASRLHYDWVAELAQGLGREFYWRYGQKHHKSSLVLCEQLLYAPPAMRDLPLLWSPPTLAMPDEYKSDDHIESYRRYYASKAATMPLVYNRGLSKQPLWLVDILTHYEEATV